jgi:hypothetical protein
MQIITGDLAKHKVGRVLYTPTGIEAPGWVLYTEIQNGRLASNEQDVRSSQFGAERVLRFHDVDQVAHAVRAGILWRGGAHADIPADGVLLLDPRKNYPIAVDTLTEPPAASSYSGGEAEEGLVTAEEVRRRQGWIDAHLPYLWRSPRNLGCAQEQMALSLASHPQSEFLHCSIRSENDRWSYATGTGSHQRVWGVCDTREGAMVLAIARMHAAWLAWHDRILDAAGGRTDWLGGVQAPEECKVYLLAEGQGNQSSEGKSDYMQDVDASGISTQAGLRGLIQDYHLSRQQVAELLDVSRHAVDAWLRPATNAAYRAMPEQMLELLIRKLAEPDFE